jgi:hypothetical protein
MSNFKDLIYALCCLSFAVVIGAGIYEHVCVWPRWSSAPPSSFTMFDGQFGLNSAPFWQSIHPLTLVLLLITLGLSWKSPRRKHVLVTLIGYVIVLTVTFIYFVPELLEMLSIEVSPTVDPSLVDRTSQWVQLSLVRLALIIGLALYLFLGLSKPVAVAAP